MTNHGEIAVVLAAHDANFRDVGVDNWSASRY